MNAFALVAAHVTVLADKVPSEDQIGAGIGYLVVFLLLAGATVFIAFSMNRHIRKARANAEAGAFGESGKTAD